MVWGCIWSMKMNERSSATGCSALHQCLQLFDDDPADAVVMGCRHRARRLIWAARHSAWAGRRGRAAATSWSSVASRVAFMVETMPPLLSGGVRHVVAGVIIFAILMFVGFELSAALGEETKDPKKSIPRAVISTIAIVFVFYVITQYTIAAGSGGAITLDGTELSKLPAFEVPRHGVGYVPQGRRLFSELTVMENLRQLIRPWPDELIGRGFQPHGSGRQDCGAGFPARTSFLTAHQSRLTVAQAVFRGSAQFLFAEAKPKLLK